VDHADEQVAQRVDELANPQMAERDQQGAGCRRNLVNLFGRGAPAIRLEIAGASPEKSRLGS